MTTKPRKPLRLHLRAVHPSVTRQMAMVAELFSRAPSGLSQLVLVIDLSPASVEAMVEKVGVTIKVAIQDARRSGGAFTDSQIARAALASLGITAGKRGRK